PLPGPWCYYPRIVSYYGVFLDLDGRSCAVVGGGEVAARKVEALLRAGARIRVIAPQAMPGLAARIEAGEVAHEARSFRAGDLRGVFLAIAATDDEALNRAVAAEARALCVLVNVVDAPELSSFIAPALLERGDLQVAVSTSGAAPALAAGLRDRIAGEIGPEYAAVLRLLRRVRERLREERRPAPERQRILRELAASDLPERVRARDVLGVDHLLRRAVGPEATLDRLGIAFD
ncbi:MAG: precorrin-2 dehydrogenase/sirohydrochlorin ferrochelatase family protein, partial [Candidatus Binatia bacterium]